MKIIDQKQMQYLDQQATIQYKIPSIILMENAGIQLASKILKLENPIQNKNIIIIAGPGNNAGDAFVCARSIFKEKKIYSNILICANHEQIPETSKINLDILKNLQFNILFVQDSSHLEEQLLILISPNKQNLIIDALFGIGLSSIPYPKYQKLIIKINAIRLSFPSYLKVISIDTPSGLIHKENTKNNHPIIQADYTLCIELPKIALMDFPGFEKAGKIHIIKIGFPQKLIHNIISNKKILSKNFIASLLPNRKRNSHKGHYGNLLIIGGSLKYPGAILLSIQAAIVSGIGKIFLLSDDYVCQIVLSCIPEIIPITRNFLNDSEESISHWLLNNLKNFSTILFGPGLDQKIQNIFLLKTIIQNYNSPIVIDADGLWTFKKVLALYPEIQSILKKKRIILTPHLKEMSFLLNQENTDWVFEKLKYLKNYIIIIPVSIILKNAISLIFLKNHPDIIYQILGNQGMAKGGSGDVLAGILASLLGSGISEKKALYIASFLHAYSGQIAFKKKGDFSLTPSNIIQYLPKAFLKLQSLKKNKII